MPSETVQTIDKYVVLGNLGKGAKSTIWKVRDTATGQIFTLKRVIKEAKTDDRFFEQAVTEFEVSSRLDHPYLRKSFELKKIRKLGFLNTQELLLVMEYVEGMSLMQMPTENMDGIIDLFIKVARGLASLHDLGYVHADIKPKNILIIPDDGIKIIDFGQSCPIGTQKKRIQGTPDYMAPEQKDRGYLDQRTDIFNLGATLYWVLTGQKFPTTMSQSGGNGSEVASLSGSIKDIPRPDELKPEIPSSMSKLTMDCCHYHQKDRPENMREVIARLEVAKHLYLKQKPVAPVVPVVEEPKKAQPQPESFDTGAPDDDSDDFEKFIESIL